MQAPAPGEHSSWLSCPSQSELASTLGWPWLLLPICPKTITYEPQEKGENQPPGACTAELPSRSDCMIFQKDQETNTFWGQVQDKMGLCIIIGCEAGWGGDSSIICDAQVLLLFMNPHTSKKEGKREREKEKEKKARERGKNPEGRQLGEVWRGVFSLCLLCNMVFTRSWQTELFS